MTNPNRKPGVYRIDNIVTGDFYIGSTVNLASRRNAHFARLRNNIHYNHHLQSSYNKYGVASFEFTVLLICEPFELVRYEQALIDKLKPAYNKRIVADSNRGRKLSKEHKDNISKGNKGKKKPEGFADRCKRMNLGRKRTLEQIKNFSDARTGVKINYPKNRKPFTSEYKAQQSLIITAWWAERKLKEHGK